MFQISNAKKNRIKFKKLLKSNGLKKPPFIAPNVVFFKVCEDSVFTRDQLLKLNQLVSKTIKRRGKIRFPVGQLIARTEKSIGTRMGKGKGSISNWVVPIKRGGILFEVEGLKTDLGVVFLGRVKNLLSCSVQSLNSYL